MNRVIGIILLILVACNADLFARGTGRIAGRIVDSSDNTPLFYANIVIVGERNGGVSLEDGSYSITGVPEGSYTVRALLQGYESQHVDSIIVGQATVTIVDFNLNYTDSLQIYDCIHDKDGTCEIHGVKLTPQIRLLKYPLESDLKYLSGENAILYKQANEDIFPNIDLDCRPLIPKDGRIVKLYLCKKCVEARKTWLEEHADIRAIIDKRREYR